MAAEPVQVVPESRAYMPTNVIAVIDDDDAILQMLDLLLRESGYHVISSTRGADAHQFVLRSLPDLILLDLCLEDQQVGVRILKSLAHDPLTRNIPVIVCSGRVDLLHEHAPLLQQRGWQALAKPFHPPELLAQIEAALGPARVSSAAKLDP
jgi:DNA-binding response OmpR family regulator